MTYERTLLSPSPWTRMAPATRSRLVAVLWWVTEAGLIAGFFHPTYWTWTIGFTAVHAALFTTLVGGRPLVFPAQLRIAYLAFLMVAAWVPGMTWMMAVTVIGLGTNLLFGYCPLARMLYLLPWNRDHGLTLTQALRVFVQRPAGGRFRLARA